MTLKYLHVILSGSLITSVHYNQVIKECFLQPSDRYVEIYYSYDQQNQGSTNCLSDFFLFKKLQISSRKLTSTFSHLVLHR
jgi:hypothetical protein